MLLTLLQSQVAPPSGVTGRRPRRHVKLRQFEEEVNIDLLQQDDRLAADLIVALVTKGFFDGKF
jgi:hypothetical protein